MRTLYGINQSPWTERARWALDHHGVTYRYREHVPLVGELVLRLRTNVPKPSVPLLVDGKTKTMGSFDIARRAEEIGRGSTLFPRGKEDVVARWNDVAESLSSVGRAWLFRNLRGSHDAQREALPGFIPGPLRGIAARTSLLGAAWLERKYRVAADVDAEVTQILRPALEDVRAALAGKAYLLDGFTYADLVIAASLQVVRPHEGAPLGPATRAAWTNEALANEFDDLLMWRDAVYRKHR
jgi:glutathione S-transferase